MIFKLLLATVVLVPLPFASVYPWSTSLLAVIVGILLIAWHIERIVKHRTIGMGFQSIWPVVLMFTFTVFWVSFQTIHYVPESIKASLWGQASDALGIPLVGAISIDPEATITALMGLFTYAGIFWLSFQYGRKTENADIAIKSIVLSVFFYASYGLWVFYTCLTSAPMEQISGIA